MHATTPPGHGLRHLWLLEPTCHFLNHGSYGATPLPVLEAQTQWRETMEQQPVRFMGEVLPTALRHAAARLADFVGAQSSQLAFVENTTAGINAVLRSFPWISGDEIVLADHAYPAVRNTVNFLVTQFGLKIRLASIDFPLRNTEDIAQAYCANITQRTRLAIVDHVFSPLAVITPLSPVIAHCDRLGVAVVVDGAHGPGMLPLSLDALQPHWYVGNCHKWMCAPKGTAFIYQSSLAPCGIHPAVLSNFVGEGFTQEFDWQGTRDCSGWLSTTAAIDFLQAFGVDRYQRFLHDQALQAASMLCQRWNVALPAPAEAFGAMVTLPWPHPAEATAQNAKRLHDSLWNEHRIEVPVIVANARLWLRISAQIYNEMSDYEALADAVTSSVIGL